MSGRSLNPGRLVAVYPRKISRFRYCAYLQQFIRSSNHRKSTSDCSGRPRRIPIVFDEFICLTLSTTDGCIACLNPRRNGEQQLRSDREVFSRRYESMDPEDLSSIMRVKLDEVITTFGELFKCVFCYKGFGILIRDLHKLRLNWPDFAKCMDHPDPLTCLTPFVIGDREIFIEPHHLPKVKAMSDLFCIRMPRLHEEITCEAKGIGDAPCKIHEGENVHHAGVWEYSWSVMEAPAKRAVLEIPYSLLVGGISALVGRHYLCEGCELNIYRSLLYLFEIRGEDYDLLLDEDEEGDPIIFDSLYVCKKADLPYNHKSFSSKDINHFKNFLSSATNEYHIHLEESEKVVRHMMALVAPEIDPKVPLTERRSAADIIGGQNCFLLAMGLILFRRFQSMGEKYKESKASVNGFTYTVLSLMRANFEKAYEKKRGLMDLDRICKEIEEEEPKKEASKSAKKRAKKNRRKERLMNQDENDQNAGNIVQEEEEEPHLDIKEDKMNANEKPITFELVVPEEIIKKEDSILPKK
ncbi:Gametogenetin-binding protein 2-like [Caligus rogercresseyi]|uniref:Gametogenetin-binding protein 2-like n=1 Tax=Caligus rogercresseyi TaxID=217165 RepID=A0A7T8KAD5_CALRO|nr:Gametogenetin-binding protein 2-like [Caligus rogercresseyi]